MELPMTQYAIMQTAAQKTDATFGVFFPVS